MADKEIDIIEESEEEEDSSDDDDDSIDGGFKKKITKHDDDEDEDNDDEEDEDDDEEDNDEEDDVGEEFDAENEDFESKMDIGPIDFSSESDEEDEEDIEDKNHLQKFNEAEHLSVLSQHHPELIMQNNHEVDELCVVLRNAEGIIDDPHHRTVPFITKYERAKILGERAKQINAGATPFVEVNQDIVDGYLIALAEFEQKKIPMIIRRPLPNNQSEYWRLEDLEIL
jgi:DNA-directed RNA polymerase subunit K/omega